MIFSFHVFLKIIMKIDQLLERLLCVMGCSSVSLKYKNEGENYKD